MTKTAAQAAAVLLRAAAMEADAGRLAAARMDAIEAGRLLKVAERTSRLKGKRQTH